MRITFNWSRYLGVAALAVSQLMAQGAQAVELKEIKRTGIPGSTFPISLTVSVPADARFTYVSGTLADVANADAPKGSIESYGDTQTQTASILKKIEKLLAAEGMTLADVVKVNVFLV